MPNVVATRYPAGRPRGNPIGTRFVQEMRDGEISSSFEGEITEYEEGRLIGKLMWPEAFAMHVVYHVVGDQDWTLLEFGCDVKPKTWRGYLMTWYSRRLLISILDQQLARLRLTAEGRLHGSGDRL